MSPPTEVATDEASDLPNEMSISGSGRPSDLNTIRRLVAQS
jgi:hypothetical protein